MEHLEGQLKLLAYAPLAFRYPDKQAEHIIIKMLAKNLSQSEQEIKKLKKDNKQLRVEKEEQDKYIYI